jgi:hypothetical protein
MPELDELIRRFIDDGARPVTADEACERVRSALDTPDSPRRSRRRRRLARWGIPLLGIGLVGGGVAAAAAISAPSPKDAATIESHITLDERLAHLPGWRPELGAEQVDCNYLALHMSRAGGPLTYGQASISHEPLTEPLTERMIIEGCASGNYETHSSPLPSNTSAKLCVTTPPASAENGGMVGAPVVVFGTTCSGAGYLSDSGVVDQVNQRRTEEAAIDAAPEACPTRAQMSAWVKHELAVYHLTLPIRKPDPGRGSCWKSFVDWYSPHSFRGANGKLHVGVPGPGFGYIQLEGNT